MAARVSFLLVLLVWLPAAAGLRFQTSTTDNLTPQDTFQLVGDGLTDARSGETAPRTAQRLPAEEFFSTFVGTMKKNADEANQEPRAMQYIFPEKEAETTNLDLVETDRAFSGSCYTTGCSTTAEALDNVQSHAGDAQRTGGFAYDGTRPVARWTAIDQYHSNSAFKPVAGGGRKYDPAKQKYIARGGPPILYTCVFQAQNGDECPNDLGPSSRNWQGGDPGPGMTFFYTHPYSDEFASEDGEYSDSLTEEKTVLEYYQEPRTFGQANDVPSSWPYYADYPFPVQQLKSSLFEGALVPGINEYPTNFIESNGVKKMYWQILWEWNGKKPINPGGRGEAKEVCLDANFVNGYGVGQKWEIDPSTGGLMTLDYLPEYRKFQANGVRSWTKMDEEILDSYLDFLNSLAVGSLNSEGSASENTLQWYLCGNKIDSGVYGSPKETYDCGLVYGGAYRYDPNLSPGLNIDKWILSATQNMGYGAIKNKFPGYADLRGDYEQDLMGALGEGRYYNCRAKVLSGEGITFEGRLSLTGAWQNVTEIVQTNPGFRCIFPKCNTWMTVPTDANVEAGRKPEEWVEWSVQGEGAQEFMISGYGNGRGGGNGGCTAATCHNFRFKAGDDIPPGLKAGDLKGCCCARCGSTDPSHNPCLKSEREAACPGGIQMYCVKKSARVQAVCNTDPATGKPYDCLGNTLGANSGIPYGSAAYNARKPEAECRMPDDGRVGLVCQLYRVNSCEQYNDCSEKPYFAETGRNIDAPDPRDYAYVANCTNDPQYLPAIEPWSAADYAEPYDSWKEEMINLHGRAWEGFSVNHDYRMVEGARHAGTSNFDARVNDECTPALRGCLEVEMANAGTENECECMRMQNYKYSPAETCNGDSAKMTFMDPKKMGLSFATCGACTPALTDMTDIPAEEKGMTACNSGHELFISVQSNQGGALGEGVAGGSAVTFAGAAVSWVEGAGLTDFFIVVADNIVNTAKLIIANIPDGIKTGFPGVERFFNQIIRTYGGFARQLRTSKAR